MESKKKINLAIIIAFFAGLIFIYFDNLRFAEEQEKEREEYWELVRKEGEIKRKERIEKERIEKIENAYKYTDECRLNKDCWKNAFESLQKAMDKDLMDGIIDEDWSMVKYEIFENMQKIASEDFKWSILSMFYDYFINYNSSTTLYKNKNGEIYF